MIRYVLLPTLFLAAIALATTEAFSQPDATKTYLLHVTKGQLPTDTGTDDTKVSTENRPEFGGKALKVVLINSFGDKDARVKNWRAFSVLAFDVFNPEAAPITIGLNIKHAQTRNYDTRVDMPIALKPGKNQVRIDIAGITNSNGSAPNLAAVDRWYIAAGKKTATLYFSDFWFEGGTPPPAAGAGSAPLIGYKIKGKIGAMDVDLTVTPFVIPGTAAPRQPAGKVGGDPARLARIRAAKMPNIVQPIMFNTPEADAICSALEIMPADNPWNLVIEDWPVLANSKKMIDTIGAQKVFRYNPDMGFILVPPDQKRVDVKIVGYPEESDKGPFPVPAITPIEGWPAFYQGKKITLDDVQRDKLKENGDRHAVVVDPTNHKLYEFYQLKKVGAGWQATQSSIFDLKSNKLRPDGWTSTDAAGLPLFPATVRYDELKRGIVEHTMRVTFVKTRRAYVYPATHYASKLTDENLPRMGERFRLKKDVDIKGFSPEAQAILKGLQKYGMMCADNGIDWAISVAPDPRIPVLHEELRKIKGSDFEVVTPPPGYEPPQ